MAGTSAELQRHPMATQWTQGSRPTEAPPPPLPRRRHSTGGPALDSVRLGRQSLQTRKGQLLVSAHEGCLAGNIRFEKV